LGFIRVQLAMLEAPGIGVGLAVTGLLRHQGAIID
jgi:hypothetical protein